ncbi:MAG: sugar ABC transporter permease [Candidatus Omnitrophica bacterium]|nr:sugar ABC transporter permease [Candidatus Omnitrophota bacterium]
MARVNRDALIPYAFLLPALVLFVTFSIYPFYLLTYTSLFEWDGIGRLTMKAFVGLSNYWHVIARDHVFWKSFLQAGYITVLALTLQNALALVLAMAVNRRLTGASIYRTIFFLPPILSEIVVGLIWFWIYDGNFGILNQALVQLGLGAWTRPWLADPNTALTAVAIIHMWKGFGWGFVIFLAGLQTIPDELYEAARVDGANAWLRFRHITLPLLVPVFVTVSILTILGTMQIFALIVSTTGGGPGYHTEVPITRIFHSMLGSSQFGYACAQGIVFGLILLVFSLAQMRFQRRST